MPKHQKHTAIKRRNTDFFAPNEIALLGTDCNTIANLVYEISKKLPSYKLAYFDASHSKENQTTNLSEFVFHHQGKTQIVTSKKVNKYALQLLFSHYDCVFINGNHYQGAKQILILDPKKEASVLKRVAQLDRIQFIIKRTKDVAYFSFLEKKYPQIEEIPFYMIDAVDKIASHINHIITKKIAPIKGLVLIGGKSTRMGMDKSKLEYYGKPQKEYAKELLEKNDLETFFSVEKEPKNNLEICDTFFNLGPFGGICSAFQKDPNTAWLVLATDLPFVNKDLISLLLKKRNPSKIATAIKGKNKQFPEPLITIYEPKAYPILLQYLSLGYSCPRKMLINSDIEIIEVEDTLIQNINTKKEYEQAKKEIKYI